MATGDYTDKAAVKQHVGIPTATTTYDDLLDVLVTAVSRAIDGYCRGRQFYATTETRYFDYVEPYRLWLDKDLISITTLTSGGVTLTDGTDFVKWPYSGPPYRRLDVLTNGGALFQFSGTPQRAISLAGSWGYAATTPTPVALAAKLWCAVYIARQGREGVSSKGLSDAGGDFRVNFEAFDASNPPPLVASLLTPFVWRDYR